MVQKYYDVNIARFLMYAWTFFNIMRERVKTKYFLFVDVLLTLLEDQMNILAIKNKNKNIKYGKVTTLVINFSY